MAIDNTLVLIGDSPYLYTHSDAGLMIRKKGTAEMYVDAYDVDWTEYEETDTAIPAETDGEVTG